MEIKNLDNLAIREKDIEAIKKFVEDINGVLGDQVISVIIYGSAVKDNYFPGSSDLNLMVLVPDFTIDLLKKVSPIIKSYHGRSKINTFIADIDDLKNAVDVFPIRYLDMKSYHYLLQGKDVLEEIEIDLSNLRLDLERQLRNIVLQLRHMYIHSNYTAGELRTILVSNFSSFSHLLSALLYINNITPPVKKQDIIKKASETFSTDFSVLDNIISLKQGGNNPPRNLMQSYFDEYLKIVDQIMEVVDRMQVL